MKKIIIICSIFLFVLGACTNDFEEMNKSWENPTEATIGAMFNKVTSKLMLVGQERAYHNGFMYPASQLGALYGVSSYPIENAATDLWKSYYQTLATVRLLESELEIKDASIETTNIQAMLKILVAYQTLHFTDYYGDVPFSDAGKGALGDQYFQVKYDTQQSIYITCLNDLKWAVENLDVNPNQYSLGSYDQLLDNDFTKWKEWGNSLRLRFALRMRDKDQSTADTHIKDVFAKGYFIKDGEDVGIWYTKNDINSDDRYWSFRENCYLRMGSTMWNEMSDNDATDGSGIFDPRCRVFFEPNQFGEWVAYVQNSTIQDNGAPYSGSRETNWSYVASTSFNYSPFNFYLISDKVSIPDIVQSSAEVHFLKAEAILKGIVTGDAKVEYEAGVRASQIFWNSIPNGVAKKWDNQARSPKPPVITDTDINTYLAHPKVSYDLATDKLTLVYKQRWIDLFRQPWEAWSLWRQTNKKTPYYNIDPSYDQVYRLTYPSLEDNYNNKNYLNSPYGGTNNKTTGKMWWMAW